MKNTKNPIARLAGETAIYGLGTMVPRFLNYLLVPLYTILVFSKSDYGQVTLLYSYVAIILVLLTFGMETAFFRYANLYKKPIKVYNTALSSILLISALFLIIIFTFTDNIAQLIQYPSKTEYVQIIALIIAIDAITAIPFAYLRYKNKAMKFSSIRIISVVITVTLNLVFLVAIPKLFGESYSSLPIYRGTSLVTFVFISNLIGSLSSLLLLWKELKTFSFKIHRELLGQMLKYGLPILLISLAAMISEVSDKILLKYLLPNSETADEQLGIYGACYKLAIIMMLFIQMFRYAAEPFFFAESKKLEAKQTYSRVMTIFVAFTWGIFLLVTLNLNLFKYFIGKSFWDGLSVVPIILSAKLFLGIFYNLSVWYKLTNKTAYGAIIAIVGALATIILNVIFIPIYGFMGSAWANFISYFIMMVISYLWGRKIYYVNYKLIKIAFYTITAIVIYFISFLTDKLDTIPQLLINNTLLFVYILVFILFDMKSKKSL